MNAPAQGQQKPTAQPGEKASASVRAAHRRQSHRHAQQYRRTSAIIDERPDGKPLIFGFGRHLTKHEKEHVQRRIAYSALGIVVAISLVIVAWAVFHDNYLYPRETVASVDGHGISRGDRDAYAKYETAQLTSRSNGAQIQQDPVALSTQQMQKNLLVRLKAQSLLGIQASDADAKTKLTDEMKTAGGDAGLQRFLSYANISKDNYLNFVIKPSVLRDKVGKYLLRNAPKTAEQWHAARIQVSTKKAAQAILTDLVSGKKNMTFAKLAASKSLDPQTKDKGGDLGWQRAMDSGMPSTFLQALKSMQKANAKYQVVTDGQQWDVLEYLGYDAKHPLNSTQLQADQVTAYNTWYQPLELHALFVPALPANPLTSAPQITQPTSSRQVTIPSQNTSVQTVPQKPTTNTTKKK